MSLLRVFCFLAFTVMAFGADRALLVGIGNYDDPQNNLPGIDLDLANHEKMLIRLGFAAGSIHTIRDRDANIARIRTEARDWLARGGGLDDRVVFYFSGHGTVARDAQNREVGVLVPYGISVSNGHLTGALSGEELGALLFEIHSRHVLVVLDACHSGHLTDAKGLGIVPKFFRYPGMPTGNAEFVIPRSSAKAIRSDGTGEHVVLSACRLDETAGATQKGSILTLAFAQAVEDLLRQPAAVTIEETHRRVLKAVEKSQHPEVSGNETMKVFDWSLAGHRPAPATAPSPSPAPSGGSEDWTLLTRLYSTRTGDLKFGKIKSVYKNTERMQMEIDVPSAGYLNVISIGQKDAAATVLFPNQYVQDNHVAAGRISIPNAASYYLSQEVSGGAEENEILILFSAREVNLYRSGAGKDAFKVFGESTRSTVVRPENGFLAGFATYRITP